MYLLHYCYITLVFFKRLAEILNTKKYDTPRLQSFYVLKEFFYDF